MTAAGTTTTGTECGGPARGGAPAETYARKAALKPSG